MPAYKRILLKLSGEALMGDDAYGINRATIVRMVKEIQEVTALGVQGQLEHVGGDGDQLACGVRVGLLGNLRNITGLTGFRYEMFGLGHGSRGQLRSLVRLPLLPEQKAHEQQTDQDEIAL